MAASRSKIEGLTPTLFAESRRDERVGAFSGIDQRAARTHPHHDGSAAAVRRRRRSRTSHPDHRASCADRKSRSARYASGARTSRCLEERHAENQTSARSAFGSGKAGPGLPTASSSLIGWISRIGSCRLLRPPEPLRLRALNGADRRADSARRSSESGADAILRPLPILRRSRPLRWAGRLHECHRHQFVGRLRGLRSKEHTMIEMDSLLVKCPLCGAWPMAASFPKAVQCGKRYVSSASSVST